MCLFTFGKLHLSIFPNRCNRFSNLFLNDFPYFWVLFHVKKHSLISLNIFIPAKIIVITIQISGTINRFEFYYLFNKVSQVTATNSCLPTH